jgi:DNA (cytosine-5)-methyltransferase 1
VSKRKYSVVSLFAGCGGKDLGFSRAGFDLLWANDIDAAACATYSHNLGAHIVQGDIETIDSSDIPCADVVIGGFPCQGFSIVGTRRLNDERNFLYRAMRRVIADTRPTFFVAENVRGLLNMAGGRVIAAMIDDFASLGYHVQYRLLNAQNYGVPQHRERVFIIGNRIGVENPFPTPTHGLATSSDGSVFMDLSGEFLLPYRTLRDSIGDIEQLGGLPNHEIDESWLRKRPEWRDIMRHLKPGQKLCNVRLGDRSVYTWSIPEVFGDTTARERELLMIIARNRRRKEFGPRDGNPLPLEVIETLSGFSDTPELVDRLVRKQYLVRHGHRYELKHAFNGIFRRLDWDAPSEAILTVFHSPRYYVHPNQHRPFSVREVARVQGFPDDFMFKGSLKQQYTQIGNAVPPPLAEAVATGVFRALDKSTGKFKSDARNEFARPRPRPGYIHEGTQDTPTQPQIGTVQPSLF